MLFSLINQHKDRLNSALWFLDRPLVDIARLLADQSGMDEE